MNAELLFSEFERLAEAPAAVHQLREFICDLAVQGRLVEQDPNDAPAVTDEARREDLDDTTALPSGWSEHRFGDVLKLEYGKALPKAARAGAGSVAVFGV